MSLVQPEDPTTLDEDDKRERAEWLKARIVEIDQEIHELECKAHPITKAKRDLNKEKSKLLSELRWAESGPSEDGDE